MERVTHYYLGLPKKTPLMGLIGDMGWVPGVVCHDLETLHLYNQLVKMDPDRLTRKVYEQDRSQFHTNSWLRNVRNICATIGCLDRWNDNQTINIKIALERLLKQYELTWHEECAKKVKLANYCQFKQHLGVEPYVKVNLPKGKDAL